MKPTGNAPRVPARFACLLLLTAMLIAAPAASAASFTVDSAVDQAAVDSSSDGVCDADPDLDDVSCTLRAAVQEANGTPGPDVITLPRLDDDYSLDLAGAAEDQAETGDLDLNESVSIAGVDQPRIDGALADRVFDAGPDADQPPAVTIRGLDLAHGRVAGPGARGGGVLVEDGSIELDQVSVEDSTAQGSGARGGGIWLASEGPHLVRASTVARNVAVATSGPAGAGGIGSEGDAALTNVTVSDNFAVDDLPDSPQALGGGVYAGAESTLSLTQSTIAGNFAASPSVGDAAGGNVAAVEAGTIELRATIVAQGSSSTGFENCFASGSGAAIISLGGNLEAHTIAPEGQCDPREDLGDKSALDARLAPLDHQGGPTETRALTNRSPALESVPHCWPVSTDQRGLQRPSGYACDAGAFERQQPLPPDRCFGRRATMFGTAGEERIVGTPRADVIIAFAQSDVVLGGAGNDRICAGKGNDVARGGPGNDFVSGGLGRDRIYGNAGADHLYGNRGVDHLNGGPSRDLLDGGSGGDRCLRGGDRRKSC
ncbi:MAG: calcium-binding protein [Solirubrobacterales bacterium]|nr:calcium-binding protein [Solirubrobacterales bacterium]